MQAVPGHAVHALCGPQRSLVRACAVEAAAKSAVSCDPPHTTARAIRNFCFGFPSFLNFNSLSYFSV